MRYRWIAAMFVVASAPTLGRGQGAASCVPALADACQKADDVYTYLFPQLGTALSGGHAILGASDILGGLGHFSIGARASGVLGSLPDLDRVSVETGPRVASLIPTKRVVVPAPALDAAIGLYAGYQLGVTRVGGVDALVSIGYLPELKSGDTDYDLPDGSTRLGLGARIGLLEESIVVPGLTVAFLRRPVPSISVRTVAEDGVSYGVENLSVEVTTWRIVATKSLLLFDLSGGFGGDRYESEGDLVASSASGLAPPQRVSVVRDIRRNTWFVGLTFGLGPLRMAAELGRVSSGSITTFNTFDPAAGSARTLVSVGARFGL